MSNEMRNEMKKVAQEAFVAGMEFNRDSDQQDFELFWESVLQKEITY